MKITNGMLINLKLLTILVGIIKNDIEINQKKNIQPFVNQSKSKNKGKKNQKHLKTLIHRTEPVSSMLKYKVCEKALETLFELEFRAA